MTGIESQSLSFLHKKVADVLQFFHAFGLAQHDFDRFGRSGGKHRRHAHRINKAGRSELQKFNELCRPRDIAPASAASLGKRPHRDVNVARLQTEMLSRPFAGFTQNTQSVRLVNHQEGAKFFFKRHKTQHIGDVAVHRENAFGHNQTTLSRGSVRQQKTAQGFAVVVRV